MDSSWLGLDDFFNTSSRLRSRRSRISLHSDSERSRLVDDAIRIDFGPRGLDCDLDFDTSAFRSSIFREFDSEFPKKTGSNLKTPAFSTKDVKGKKGDGAESAKTDTAYEDIREIRLKLQHCQDENIKLQSVITDLTQVNKRWQKYNSDRQLYVQKLLNTIQDQQEQLNHIGERSFNSSAGQSSSSSSSINDGELERLRNVEQKLKEKVSILEFQVKAHRDDWEAELSEKKQALKDKGLMERKVTELLREMHISTAGESRVELYCQNCGRVTENNPSPPSRSRIYRTAVHLPCSPSRRSSTTSSTGDDLVIDSRGLRHPEVQARPDGPKKMLNIDPEERSYSRSSTVPLLQTSTGSVPTTTHSSSSSISGHPVSIKSFVQIPITKSFSVPESSSAKLSELPRMSLETLKYSTHVPPVSVVNSAEQYDGIETLSAENVICLRCGEVFPPDMHLQFLDHFPQCQSSRNHKHGSNDNLSKCN